ncbi:alpha/beta fold hydrolase [Pseudanabaena sp. FACHB-2040]|uniref:alpha/beta fold hydrolase n=1 Tax=Pseudanabaena sp. FACHB-2040 TaxID=2692859 RepID=UPI00168604FC|nr:alpha/beta fold hydrolase [Pseudanabaena sp. FACHB-2040]MBD2258719.1 alpha/beta fold hydrolase [Pseudanabaena sp. FACHB-2040]
MTGTTSATSPILPLQTWSWQGFPIRYQQAGQTGAPILCIHGFGASSNHWLRNLPVLAQTNRVYALDLIGFGLSAKPAPNDPIAYTFETWGEQIIAFCREVVGEPVFLVGNSIGCIVALQATVMAPEWVQGIAMLDCSLRLLHDRKRMALPWYRRSTAPLLQQLLGYRPFGRFFFSRIARPQVIRKLLGQAYRRAEAVTEELVNHLLEPALQTGAADVFLAFVRYSQGPLAEDLLPAITCPVLILWGADDPWEPVELGRALAEFPAVEDFIVLEGIGHCPQDEAPELVNPILQDWVARHCDAKSAALQ